MAVYPVHLSVLSLVVEDVAIGVAAHVSYSPPLDKWLNAEDHPPRSAGIDDTVAANSASAILTRVGMG